MEITRGLQIKGEALAIGRSVLVISDLHLGIEGSLVEKGLMVPKVYFKETLRSVEGILKGMPSLKTIVVNGDLKHEFGKISRDEWKEAGMLLSTMQKYCSDIRLVKGNHDTILGPLAAKMGLKLAECYLHRNIAVVHGDKIVKLPGGVDTIIIGHEHPAITLGDGIRHETYKCFLVGKYKGKRLVVMPSICSVSIGIDVLKGQLLSPYLAKGVKNFVAVVVADGRAYDFGKVSRLGER